MYAKKKNICIWRLDNYTTFSKKQALLKFLGDFVIRSHSQSSIVTSSDELYLAGLFSDPSTTKNFMRGPCIWQISWTGR
jgi:hypothetical protein